jgi:Domain of unknown function (DUF4037)
MVTSAVPLRTNGELAHWWEMGADYPDAVAVQEIASASEGWMFAHWVALSWAYIERGELFAFQRRIINDLSNALRILWAINRQWGPHMKWVKHSSPALKIKPERLIERIEAILTAPPPEAVAADLGLVLEILALVPPQFDVSRPINNIRANLRANIKG